jgi:glycosyltransferase involved in cell wall biosynthesis
VRLAVVTYHVPHPGGSAAGRLTYAVCTGLLELGHDVRAWAWQHEAPRHDPPGWCRWTSVPAAGALRVRMRSLIAPRTDLARATPPFDGGWLDGAVHVAEDAPSFAGLAGPRRVLSMFNLTALDEAAIGRRTPAGVQDRRAERTAARRAARVLGYSTRVAAALGGSYVPAAYPIPAVACPPASDPAAFVAADWRWAPNRWALDRLLRSWPAVRDAVAGARLRLAGVGLDDVGSTAGVEVLGPVPDTAELLAGAAVVPFPYPPTSGPKVKIMEALASGIPVVTTRWGLEGLHDAVCSGAVVVDDPDDVAAFAAAIAGVLRDPAAARARAAVGRAAMIAHHAPVTAAAARAAALATAFGAS